MLKRRNKETAAMEPLDNSGEAFIVVCAVALALIVPYVASKYNRIDGAAGAIGALFFGDDTEYADGYSHEGFLQIKQGMTEAEVREILGEPLESYQADDPEGSLKSLHYSRSARGDIYRWRWIKFDQGAVVAIKAGPSVIKASTQ